MLATLLADDYSQYILLAVMVVIIALIVVFYFLSNKKRKKQEQDAQDLINAVKPGNKVKTIGGICGIVVEVDNEENTFVLETGTEASGKSYLKFDRQAIYQTDAVVEKKEEVKEAPAVEADVAEAPATETAVIAPVDTPATVEVPADAEDKTEAPAEEKPEPVKPKKKGKNDAEEKQVKF